MDGWCEYMDGWEKFSEMALPTKKEFYSNLTIESITDVDYKHEKRVQEKFGLQNHDHELYVQSDIL